MGIGYGKKTIPTEGLISFFDPANSKCYNSSDSFLTDLINTENKAQLNNGTLVSDENIKVLYVDGADDRVTVQNPNLTFSSEITVEAWIKVLHTGNYGYLFVQNNPNGLGRYGLAIRGNDGQVIHYIGDSSSSVGGWWVISRFGGLLTGPSGWNHLCSVSNLSISGNTNRWFYINGVLRASRTQAFTSNQVPFSTSADLILVNNNFKGNVNDLKIYNKALTQEEVSKSFAQSRDRYGV